MLFYLGIRLLALGSIPATILPPISSYTSTEVAAGVVFGMLEDALVVALLVVTLVSINCACQLIQRTMQRWIGERYPVRILFSCIHHASRLAVILTLVVSALTPSAIDMVLVRSIHTRLSAGFTATLDRHQEPQHEPSLVTITVIATAVYCTIVTLVFACVVETGDCLPSFRVGRGRKPSETSYLTPTYLHLGFSGYNSPLVEVEVHPSPGDPDSGGEMDQVNVTIVSAPSSISEGSESVADSALNLPSLGITTPPIDSSVESRSRSRYLLGSCIFVAVYALVSVVVCAISRDASPLVSAVAVNATLNALFRFTIGTS